MRSSAVVLCVLFPLGAARGAEGPGRGWEDLSDLQGRFLYVQQGWGEMGIDAAAHAPGKKPLELQIKDETFRKGIGHHAPGEIVVDLAGEYDLFEAKVGVLWQGGNVGSVVFQVFIDGEKRFESPLMKESDRALPLSVPVKGASELRLAVTDGGDGITCDCANWAEARLRRAAEATPAPAAEPLDIAPFGRVMAWDPARTDGARANRIEEYRAEDVFLGDEIRPDSRGEYRVPFFKDGRGCLGLEWIERRRLRELSLGLAPGSGISAERLEVQGWLGESPWQGSWKPLQGKAARDGDSVRFRIDWRGVQEARGGLRKVRWIFPEAPEPLQVKSLHALSASRTEVVELPAEVEGGKGEKPSSLEVYNGELIASMPPGGQTAALPWSLEPIILRIRAVKPSPWSAERTVIRFKLPAGECAVGVADVTSSGPVYIPEVGLFVATPGAGLQEYKIKIQGRKTILEEVRESPEQTFEQALAKTRNKIQSNGPMLLSLACDERKFIVDRDGKVQRDAFLMAPRFGSGKNEGLRRWLQGSWLPVPVISVNDGGLVYRQRTFVAPFGEEDPAIALPWIRRKPLCVSAIELENPGGEERSASISLSFLRNAEKKEKAAVEPADRGALALDGRKILVFVDGSAAPGLRVSMGNGELSFEGMIPAGGTALITVFLPAWDMEAGGERIFRESGGLLKDVEAYWTEILGRAARIEVPDRFLLDVIRASQVHCLIAARSEAGGERIAPWIASMSYGPLESESNSVIRGMDFLGHHEFARRSLDFFIHRYNEKGFLTTGYTLLGTGWHLWMLGEHHALARDREWLTRVAPKVSRVCLWIMGERRKTRRVLPWGEKVPEYGLMPPGVIADWNAFAFYFSLNGYYSAGLRSAAEALSEIGSPEAKWFLEDSEEFRRDILRSYRFTQARTPAIPLRDGTWVRGYPSQVHCPGPTALFFPGEDGNRSWAYDVELGAHQLVPLGLLDPGEPDVAGMLNHMEDVQFLSEGWFDYPAEASRKDPFNLGGFSKVQPFYCRNAEVYALRDDVKPFIRSYFNALSSLLNTEVLSLWEHFHNAGAWCKTHETGYFLHQTRTLLVQERGEDLWLAAFTPSAWLEDGKSINLDSAPTRFGPVSFRIRSSVQKGFVEATVKPPARNPPRQVVLRIRHPEGKAIRAVQVNGAAHGDFDPQKSCIRIPAEVGEVSIRAEF